MSNVTRISRFMHDSVKPEERLLFTQRRRSYKPLWWLVVLALALWMMPAFGETIAGKTRHGMAFVVTKFTSGPLLEFTVYFTTERG